VQKFEAHARDHLGRFFSFRGALLKRKLANEEHFIKEQLWHTRALLGFLEDPQTRQDLKNGKVPTLVRFERPPRRTLHERILQNVPLFGVSAASLISMGVPLPWNMVGGGLATAVREYSEEFKSHQDFEKALRAEFKRTGRDPETYLQLYRHLDTIIPHPLTDHGEDLPLKLRLQNYKQLKAFHSKLEELHHFATAYLEGLRVLQQESDVGIPWNQARDAALTAMLKHVRGSKAMAERLQTVGPSGVHSVPDEALQRVQQSEMVQDAVRLVQEARSARHQPSRGSKSGPRKKK